MKIRSARPSSAGFTLVEIAIVLVIIGLILGGVLKGQELVTSARVRNIADQQNAIKAAYFAFQDRYHALPGDYNQASTTIPGLNVSAGGGGSGVASATDGDGDGFIAYSAVGAAAGAAAAESNEQVWAFLHLTAAGFISCAQCLTGGVAGGTPSQSNSPLNAYSGALGISYDNNFGTGSPNATNNLKSGNKIPSNILAEVDSKLDDGNPYTGVFQFSPFGAPAPAAGGTSTGCVLGTTVSAASWNRQNPVTNCGASYTF